MEEDPIYLSYDDSLLRKSDVDLLHGPHWLNDNVISFYFEFLKNTFKESPHILFVSPEVTQCIKITPTAQITVFLDPLDAKSRRFIFFALNDNERPQTAGGTHWSLLLLSCPDRTVYHYDSFRGSNGQQAREFAVKLFSYFSFEGRFKEPTSLQQTNGYDCGIYLLCNAEHLAKHLAKHNSVDTYNCVNQDLRDNLRSMRKQMIAVIDSLKKELLF